VSARLEDDGRLRLTLGNRGSRPAHFAIYPYSGELVLPKHVDVKRRHTEHFRVAGGYRLAIQGPNRFWYELAGSRLGAAAGVDVRPGGPRRGGKLALELENAGRATVNLRLAANGHGRGGLPVRLRPGTTRSLSWDTDDGWYDIEVTAREDPAFRRRLTGRVEDGRPGVTP
jgi:phospholipase C